jgi:hypothetical protein
LEINYTYLQYSVSADAEKSKREKYLAFKQRIENFKLVRTIEQARELAQKILPTSNEITMFDVGNAKCVVINSLDLFRITIDSPEECICYDFVSHEADAIEIAKLVEV